MKYKSCFIQIKPRSTKGIMFKKSLKIGSVEDWDSEH